MPRTRSVLAVALLLCSCQCENLPPVAPHDGGSDADSGVDAGACLDSDGDGFGEGCPAPDCDDANAAVKPGADEVCGDGLDNDCDGEIDEGLCPCTPGKSQECFEAEPAKAGVGLCRKGVRHCGSDRAWGECEGQVLPTGESCDGLDNDCNGEIDNGGVANACGGCGPVPAEVCNDGLDNDCNGAIDDGCGTCDPGCLCTGTSCVCHPATGQPCYSGPAGTAGVGACRSGRHDCADQGGGQYAWTACQGEALPQPEACGDGIDNDCDDEVDEGCAPDCTPQAEVCDGLDNDCDRLVDEGVTNACGGCGPGSEEICDGLDNDCDGRVDPHCACTAGQTQECYRGPAETRNQGLCHSGTQSCSTGELSGWGRCQGDVLPTTEVCGDGQDNDCDGIVDDGCACLEGETRSCGSSAGECSRGTQTCAGGAWGSCEGGVVPASEICDGLDNDCDGLIDEEVLNACGLCPPAPCYTESYDSSEDLAEGTSDGVSQTPSNPLHPDCAPGNLCLDSTTSSLPYIWVANTGDNTVVKLDTGTGQRFGPYPANGDSPSRTAVVPLDGSVWVGNRGLTNPGDPNLSNAVHLAADGSLICRADITGIVRAVALDANGDVWVGSYNESRMYRVSGYLTDPGTPTRCRILGHVDVSARPYGAAVDSQNHVWVAGNSNWGSSFDPATQALSEIDADTQTLVANHVPDPSIGCFNTYGIAVDSDRNVWIGGYGCNSVFRYAPSNNQWTRIPLAEGMPRGVAVSPDNHVYVAVSHHPNGSGDNTKVVSIDRATNAYTVIELGSQAIHPIGVAIDASLKVWAVALSSGTAVRIDPVSGAKDYFPVGNQPYTYSDMTGLQNQLYTRPSGTWTLDFDSAYASPHWSQIRWTSIEPPGTTVSARGRSAPDRASLATATWSAWGAPSPADISSLPSNRWLQIQLRLETNDPHKTPVVQQVEVLWER